MRVYLPRSLVALFPGVPREIAVADAAAIQTVADLLRHLDRRWPGMWDRLCTAGPQVREHINIFVDGEKAELNTPLRPGAVVRVIPAVSGGEEVEPETVGTRRPNATRCRSSKELSQSRLEHLQREGQSTCQPRNCSLLPVFPRAVPPG